VIFDVWDILSGRQRGKEALNRLVSSNNCDWQGIWLNVASMLNRSIYSVAGFCQGCLDKPR